MKITSVEEAWLKKAYAGLLYDKRKQRLIGDLPINALWDKTNFISYDIPEARAHPNFLSGVFQIEIYLTEINQHSGLPETYETGGDHRRIAKSASQEIRLEDLHINNDEGNCCLHLLSKYEERRLKVDLKTFLEKYVIPFFYRLLYVENHGLTKARKELWEELPHGTKGRLKVNRKMREKILLAHPEDRCPCRRKAKSKNCCKPIIHLEDYCLPTNSVDKYILNFPQSCS